MISVGVPHEEIFEIENIMLPTVRLFISQGVEENGLSTSSGFLFFCVCVFSHITFWGICMGLEKIQMCLRPILDTWNNYL